MRAFLVLLGSWIAAGMLGQIVAEATHAREEFILAYVAAAALPLLTWVLLLGARAAGRIDAAAMALALVFSGVLAWLATRGGGIPSARDAALILAVSGAPGLALVLQWGFLRKKPRPPPKIST
jgi:hypothetical protein